MQQVQDTVLQEFPPVGKYKVRLIKLDDKSLPVIDIREYIAGASFEGFTRRGIRLTPDQIPGLAATLELIARMLVQPNKARKGGA